MSGKTIGTLIAGFASFLLFVIVGCAGCSTIGPGNVGILISKVGASRGVQDVTVKTGWVVVNPLTTEVIEYPTFMQTVKWTKSTDEGKASDESITFTTADQMVVNADISISYQLQYDKAPDFYVKFRADNIEKFSDGFLRNVARNSFNNVGGQYQIGDIMGNNGPVLAKIQADMQSQLAKYGIQIDQLGFIGAPRPPQGVTDAINLKAQAEQIALTKKIELTQVQADADKEVARAKGDAAANIERAQSDATSNKLRAESLTPSLLEWRKLDKWDGHLSQVDGSGHGIMLSVDGGK